MIYYTYILIFIKKFYSCFDEPFTLDYVLVHPLYHFHLNIEWIIHVFLKENIIIFKNYIISKINKIIINIIYIISNKLNKQL